MENSDSPLTERPGPSSFLTAPSENFPSDRRFQRTSSTTKHYTYLMLRVYVAHILMYQGMEKAKLFVLNDLTDSAENYIKAVAKDSKRCDHLLRHEQPNLIQIINVLKTIGLKMNKLIEFCVAINLKKYTKQQGLANEKTPNERVEFHGFSIEKANESRPENHKFPIHCACVEEFVKLTEVRTMAKDLKEMFDMEPFKPADK